jgi:hypothetical protein
MVQTIQREFRGRSAKTGADLAKSIGHGFLVLAGEHTQKRWICELWLRRVVREDIRAYRWDFRNVPIGGKAPDFGAHLVHSRLQMRLSGATESAVNHSRQMKRGEYEQGRKISKPLQLRRPQITLQHLRSTQTESCNSNLQFGKPPSRCLTTKRNCHGLECSDAIQQAYNDGVNI